MAIMFQEHPDGLVYVRTDALTYMDTRENFEADFGWTLEQLPEGITERIYIPGKRHTLQGEDKLEGGVMPYTLGDSVIAAVEQGLAAQAARQGG